MVDVVIPVFLMVTMSLLRDGHCNINGIESFWSFTKRRLAKFNGVSVNFELHLKESEWRWKKQPDELAKELWLLIRYY